MSLLALTWYDVWTIQSQNLNSAVLMSNVQILVYYHACTWFFFGPVKSHCHTMWKYVSAKIRNYQLYNPFVGSKFVVIVMKIQIAQMWLASTCSIYVDTKYTGWDLLYQNTKMEHFGLFQTTSFFFFKQFFFRIHTSHVPLLRRIWVKHQFHISDASIFAQDLKIFCVVVIYHTIASIHFVRSILKVCF